MKLFFTFFIVILVCQEVLAAATTSGNWRWRNDDGNDLGKSTVPTWKAAENTPITLTGSTQHIRLRITNYSNFESSSGTPKLAYSTNSTPTAFNSTVIPTTAGSAFKMVASSGGAINGQSSPEQISDAPGASYTPGNYSGSIYTTSNGPSSAQAATPNTKYEAEFDFVPSTGISLGTTYYFVLTASNQVPGIVLSGYPSLTVAAILPITLTGFTVTVDANGNEQIAWATTSETNNADYVIEAGVDGINFSPIATVASKNSATGASYLYTYTGGLPKGINYFRLKAVDKDGSYTYSDVKPVNVTGSGTGKIIIAPNPVLNTLNITGLQSASTIQVYNSNVQKILTVAATGAAVQQINVSNLVHGPYYVQVVTAGKVVSSQLVLKQ